MADERDIETPLRAAALELPDLHAKAEVEAWWKKYYLLVGHRRLGQLLIGRTVDNILKSKTRSDTD